MATPLDDERFKQLQRDAEVALENRPDLFSAVQRDLDVAIGELDQVVLKPRTQPAGQAGVREKPPEVALAQHQIGVLRTWLAKIVYKRPLEGLKERIKAAKQAGLISRTSTALDEVIEKAGQEDLVALRKMLADVDDPLKPDTNWVNREATRIFLQQEIAEMESLLDGT